MNAAGEWQDIATAPKDGTRILVVNAVEGVEVIRWYSDEYGWRDSSSGPYRVDCDQPTLWAKINLPE